MRMWAAALAACLLAAGCQAPQAAPSPSTPASPTSASASPAVDYTDPGEATRVLTRLASLAGTTDELLKVSLTHDTAELSVLRDKQAVTYRATAGTLAEVDDADVAYVGQSTFALADFNLNDVAGMFREAAVISGSEAAQELQIVDYNSQQVLMTVTTNPESLTVFFQPDGTLVPTLDFTTAEGIRQGLRDAVGDKTSVIGVGLLMQAGLYVDTEGPDDTTLRTLRTSQFPAWTSGRNEQSEYARFDPHVINPDVIARVIDDLSQRTGIPSQAGVSLVIDMRDARLMPTMRFQLGGTTVVTDLDGKDITAEVER